MSDQTYPTCNGCGAVNNTGANDWIRILGITLGNSMQPIQVIRPPVPGQPRTMMPPPRLDFCPNCALKITVDKLPAMLTAPTPAPKSIS
jgi:hypothetical protein